MRQIYPDLWLTEPEHPAPDELPDLMMHAYLLVREEGNILFCRSEHEADHRQIRDLGGITHQYLTHWHEAAPGLARIKDMFGSKLVCHRLAEAVVSRFSPVDLTFETRDVHLGAIEVIPTPGHTAGSTCFCFRSPHGKTYLFAGDTLFPSRGSWEAVVFDDGNEADLRGSLALLRGLEPDVVLCGASVGDVPFKAMSRAEWHAALDQAVRSLPQTATENQPAPKARGAAA
jgi:glyoxylase-like metal-dependent hydrolase (beta-lactamase superfamily II)